MIQPNNQTRNTILSLALTLAATFCAGQAIALDKTHGSLTLDGGWGSATPWKADLRLQLPTQKVRIAPFISLEGITNQGNNIKEDASYRYEKSQNLYESSSELKTKGIGVAYGTTLLAPINKQSKVDAMFEGQHRRQRTTGWWNERLTSPDGQLLSAYEWDMNIPMDNLDQFRASAGYNHKGLRVEYAFLYKHNFLEYNRDAQSGFGGSPYRTDHRTMDTKLYNHQAKLSYLFRLGKGHQLTTGLAYLRNGFDRKHVMDLTKNDVVLLSNPFFSHTYQTESAYAEYRFTHKKVKASARLEYGLTHMKYEVVSSDPARNIDQKENVKRKPIHDVLPQVRVEWAAGKHDTLTADYRMILKRPEADLLDPTHIYAAHTEDYGEVTLKGIHINNLSLTYHMRRKCVDYTSALGAIIVNDGFNALWMMDGFKQGVLTNTRLTTWGNEGKRRAYSITQRLGIRPAKGTKIMAQAVLLWDKRIAEAIHMENEHWGINAQASVEQQLGKRTTLDVHGLYTEGNTIDLYSYESRSYGAGIALRQQFCKGLTGSIGYDYREYNHVVITQGAVVKGLPVGYTGYLNNSPRYPHYVKFNLTYRF